MLDLVSSLVITDLTSTDNVAQEQPVNQDQATTQSFVITPPKMYFIETSQPSFLIKCIAC